MEELIKALKDVNKILDNCQKEVDEMNSTLGAIIQDAEKMAEPDLEGIYKQFEGNDHDCHLSPEDGCNHPSHKEQPEP